MAQFTLQWNNSAALANSNAISQRVSYRQKSVGGSFITTGFSPSNDLAVSVTTANTPTLSDNVVYEFIVQTICTTGGPTNNDNGIVEAIQFGCINPSISKTDTASTINLDVTGTNITKARFTLRKTSDNSVVSGPTVVLVSGNAASTTATGLTASTSYYWQIELYAIVGGVEVISSSGSYIGSPCGPYSFNNDAPPQCPAPTNLTVSAIS